MKFRPLKTSEQLKTLRNFFTTSTFSCVFYKLASSPIFCRLCWTSFYKQFFSVNGIWIILESKKMQVSSPPPLLSLSLPPSLVLSIDYSDLYCVMECASMADTNDTSNNDASAESSPTHETGVMLLAHSLAQLKMYLLRPEKLWRYKFSNSNATFFRVGGSTFLRIV